MLAQQSLIYSASRPRTQICWDCGRVAAYAERGCQDCWMCEQHKGVCKTERKFRERWRKVYYSSSLLLLILPGKNFTFTCLSYKFHMIGSGAAYQREEKVPDKGSAESWRIAPTHLPWEHFFPTSLWKWRQNLYLPCAAATGCTLANEHTIKQKTLKACSDFWHSCLAFITPTLLSLHQRNSWCSAKYLHLWVVHPRQAISMHTEKQGLI